jgi:GNAT superfamily N-acetyltransferase
MGAILIRLATSADTAAIARLSNQLGYKTTDEQTMQQLSAMLVHPDYCVFVAIEDEQVTGWVQCFYSMRVESDPFVEIGGLVVDEHHQRKGIGKLLVNEVINWSEKRNCNNIRVRCQTYRKEAHRFYEGIGFVETKVQKVYAFHNVMASETK